jgi:hypothetical protein
MTTNQRFREFRICLRYCRCKAVHYVGVLDKNVAARVYVGPLTAVELDEPGIKYHDDEGE